MIDKDKNIQQLLDRGEAPKESDADTAAYRTLYRALNQAPVLHFSDDFADRVVAQTQPVSSPTYWSTVFMVGCIAVALLASGFAVYRLDTPIFWELTNWMKTNIELIGFGAILLAIVQMADRWLLGWIR